MHNSLAGCADLKGGSECAAMNLLILGATGDQGRAQVEAALAHGHQVRVAVRDCGRAAAGLPPGVEVAAVDLNAADWGAEALARAARGCDALLANYPSSSFNDGRWLVDAAAATGRGAALAGVQTVVFNTSLPQRERLMGYAAHDVRFRMRLALMESRVPVVTLAPVVFMDNLLRGWAFPAIVDEGCFRYAHLPELEVSWICQADLANLMLAAAARPRLGGKVFRVGGPETLRGAEVAHRLSAAAGRPIRFESQSVEAFCEGMRPQVSRHPPAEAARLLEELGRIYRWYNEGAERPFTVDMRPVLEQLPVTLTPFADWAARQRWRRA